MTWVDAAHLGEKLAMRSLASSVYIREPIDDSLEHEGCGNIAVDTHHDSKCFTIT